MSDTGDRAAVEAANDATSSDDRLPGAPASPVRNRRGRLTRLSSVHTGLIAAAAVMVLLLIFILENAHSVNVHFFGADLRLPLAVALLLAAAGGALLVGTVGAARISQLRRAANRVAQRQGRLPD